MNIVAFTISFYQSFTIIPAPGAFVQLLCLYGDFRILMCLIRLYVIIILSISHVYVEDFKSLLSDMISNIIYILSLLPVALQLSLLFYDQYRVFLVTFLVIVPTHFPAARAVNSVRSAYNNFATAAAYSSYAIRLTRADGNGTLILSIYNENEYRIEISALYTFTP